MMKSNACKNNNADIVRILEAFFAEVKNISISIDEHKHLSRKKAA